MNRPGLLSIALLLLGTAGCASRGPAPMTQVASPCDRHWQLQSAQPLALDEVRPQVLRLDAGSRCGFLEDGRVSNYTVLRLPAFDGPWSLSLESLIDGSSLFAPEVATLDADGRVRRELPLDRFVMRGDRLQANLFFGAEDAEESYLLLRSAPQAVGRSDERVVSRSFFLPILNAVMPILYVQGTERERRYTYSHAGRVQLQARSRTPKRDAPKASDLARAELKTYLR
ncbi:MalM family protein [Panacagrimonas sp.]|uniref:MalM family protein n=1 Tax=Panacagrimonas sp. TaxID=2480088 RepID=UPI003B51FE4D